MSSHNGPAGGRPEHSRSWRLNAALLDMVRRAFQQLDAEGLTFEGLPPSFQGLDALQMLDGLALAAHEAVERHAQQLPPESLAGLRSAIDMLWRASALSDKFRAIATARTGPSLNDVAEVALLAAAAGQVLERRVNGASAEPPDQSGWARQIEQARAARTARARANWESLVLQQCRESLSQTPGLDVPRLAANVCARNGLGGAARQQVLDLINRWRSSGALQFGGRTRAE